MLDTERDCTKRECGRFIYDTEKIKDYLLKGRTTYEENKESAVCAGDMSDNTGYNPVS